MRSRVLLLTAFAALLSLCAPTSAGAAYESTAWSGCDGAFNSGSFDDAGRTYVVCGSPSTIGIYAPDGSLERSVDLPAQASDVEAVGDGALLYVAMMSGPPLRYARRADGSYAQDSTWAPEPYVMWGSTRFAPRGLFLDSDAAGNVYLADGYWASNTHTVVKYAPDGHVITRFGEFANTRDRGWFYHALGDVAVTADGATLLSIEAGNNRLQIWRRQANGSYTSIGEFGGTATNNPDRGGFCDFAGWQGAFAAPYGIGRDAAGAVYVLNTTCGQVLRFTMTEGVDAHGVPTFAFALTDNLDVRVSGQDVRPHGFVVAADGRVLVGQNARMLLPAGTPAFAAPPQRGAAQPQPVPTPDPPVDTTPEPRPGPVDSSTSTGPTAPDPVAPRGDVLVESPSSGAAPVALRTSFGVRRPFVARTRRGRVLLGTASCTRRCTVRVTASVSGRVVGSKVLPAWSGARRSVAVPLARWARGRAVRVSVTAHGIGGSRATTTRTFRVRL